MKIIKVFFFGCAVAGLGACAGQPFQDGAKAPQVQRYCLRETGTWLNLPEGRCVVAPGRVYTNDDLQRTGAMTIGQALRRLGH